MIDGFAAPYVLTSQEHGALIAGQQNGFGSNLLAAMVGFDWPTIQQGGFTVQLWLLLVVIGVVLVVAVFRLFPAKHTAQPA